jgi:hypothetical protein
VRSGYGYTATEKRRGVLDGGRREGKKKGGREETIREQKVTSEKF